MKKLTSIEAYLKDMKEITATLAASTVCTRIRLHLFSIRAAVAKGNSVKFSKSKWWIQNASGNLCGTDLVVGNCISYIDYESVSAEHTSVAHKQHSDLDL